MAEPPVQFGEQKDRTASVKAKNIAGGLKDTVGYTASAAAGTVGAFLGGAVGLFVGPVRGIKTAVAQRKPSELFYSSGQSLLWCIEEGGRRGTGLLGQKYKWDDGLSAAK